MLWLRKSMRWMILLSVIGLAGGCATTGGDYCQIARPIWWESAEQLNATPPAITRQIVVHNETIESVCPKRAPNR